MQIEMKICKLWFSELQQEEECGDDDDDDEETKDKKIFLSF